MLTPMMQQYLDIKEQHPGTLLMFRLGDFYELFFDDAVTASRVLEITLTGRDAGEAGRIPMCGVPHHAAEQYIGRLVDQGFSVAVCDQVEDAKATKGLVRREVIRVVTPGTVLRDHATNRYLASLCLRSGQFGAALVDVGTGECWFQELASASDASDWFRQWRPVEALLYEGTPGLPEWAWMAASRDDTGASVTYRQTPRHALQTATDYLQRHYEVANLVPLDLNDKPLATEAVAMCLTYIEETQKTALPHIKPPRDLAAGQSLVIDATAMRNLELVETTRSRQRKGSLFGLLDRTRTAMGSRMLRRWIERPLREVNAISARLDAVGAFADDLWLRSSVQQNLEHVYDLDRLAGKVSFGAANGRDLLALAKSLAALPDLTTALTATPSALLRQLAALPDLSSLARQLFTTLVDEPPVSIREGGIIRPGVDAVLDELRDTNASGKAWLAALEARERDSTGIKSLKVGFNKVFGYYIEVSRSQQAFVPAHYERRQTLATGERYALPELKEREAQILHAEERATEREHELFLTLRDAVLGALPDIQAASEAVAAVDGLCALGLVAVEQRYVRPDVTAERGIDIVQGRHPVVEAAGHGQFVPNDVRLGDARQLILLTGPNMAGKSTYMRQTALIVLMAHIGSFVPAQTARIGLVDRIFTRIGASDDLGAGQSTFMVEMVELAQILRLATQRSLVLLDEIGRGTSTYDGLSIAEAVMESLQVPGRQPLTLFATHYHELTEAANRLPAVVNCSVLVEETETGVAFLHTVVERPADKSYGIQVARLAGVPAEVLARATALLAGREHSHAPSDTGSALGNGRDTSRGGELTADTWVAATQEPRTLPGMTTGQTALFSPAVEALVHRLAQVDALRMTPLQALQILAELAEEAKDVRQWAKFK